MRRELHPHLAPRERREFPPPPLVELAQMPVRAAGGIGMGPLGELRVEQVLL